MEVVDFFNMQVDPKHHFSDVTFMIEDQFIYAHRFILARKSETFRTMFANRWNDPQEPIKINSTNFEDFKEFLTFFYRGTFYFTEDNFATILDLAEMYQIEDLKGQCDDYASDTLIYLANVFHCLQIMTTYNLKKLEKALNAYIKDVFLSVIESSEFMKASRIQLLALFCMDRSNGRIESRLFERIIEWIKANPEIENASDKNEKIKAEIAEFLPKFKFSIMSKHFLVDFVVKHGYIFESLDDLSKILIEADEDQRHKGWAKIRIIPNSDEPLNCLKGIILSTPSEMVEILKAIKSLPQNSNGDYSVNEKGFEKPLNVSNEFITVNMNNRNNYFLALNRDEKNQLWLIKGNYVTYDFIVLADLQGIMKSDDSYSSKRMNFMIGLM